MADPEPDNMGLTSGAATKQRRSPLRRDGNGIPVAISTLTPRLLNGAEGGYLAVSLREC